MEDFISTMNTNYFGAVRCIKAVLPGMREARKGCIVNVSSVAGRISCSPLGPTVHRSFSRSHQRGSGRRSEGIEYPCRNRSTGNPGYEHGASHRESPALTIFSAAQSCRHVPCRPVESYCSGNHRRDHTQYRRERHVATAPPFWCGSGPFLGWRAAMTDEQWVDWSAQDDETWYEQVQRDFGLNARQDRTKGASGRDPI